ncbi:MAG: aromatic amino acid hydroxylase [Bacteroidales bacterium]|nr:aromatic amino acid hydroxylase [Bacteroidales bacterium]MCF8456853.1 aromatic amino acid hydroxylase [Bacteroidales bacterium]
MEQNEILDKLPKHLMSLVIEQPYNAYTPQDHALWRYVMRQNVEYLSKVAHGSYLDGLKKTGISIERIPHMYGMNRILKEIGWAAVAVDGFIPPAGFMEFQAYNVLVIAADIRPIDQIGYTPAPDIIHEAAGHAPIIADPDYANYLRRFGEIGCKAFQSAGDYKMYEAIRHLSIVKADPYTDKKDIAKANEELLEATQNLGEPSEMALIRNLHWWTVEYGLIGDLKNPKIYGAGLLSSISESYNCLQPKVKKLPYTLDAVNYSFDITEQQPQLFVTPDFETLTRVLEEFADTMALRKGGLDGIQKAIVSKNTATCEYSSGLQVSGTFTEMIEENGLPIYLKTTGPTSLCWCNTELPGHDKGYHSHGFSSPIGRIKNLLVEPEYATDDDLKKVGIALSQKAEFEFESGIKVKGILRNITHKEGRLLLLSFSDCHVRYKDKDLFLPDWGMFDMAVGNKIISAFNGPADPDGFGLEYAVPVEKTHKINHSEKAKHLHKLYQKVRDIRERNCSLAELPHVWDEMKTQHPEDWLCSIEILELLKDKGIEDEFYKEVKDFLIRKKTESPQLAKLIEDGFSMLK